MRGAGRATHPVAAVWKMVPVKTRRTIMAIKRRPRACERVAQPEPGILLWLLRILVPLGGHRELKTSYGFKSDSLVLSASMGEHGTRADTE